MLYNANNGRKQTMNAKKEQVKKKVIPYSTLLRSQKSQKCPKVGTFGNFGENDITQSCLRMLYNANNGRKQTMNAKKEQVNKKSKERREGKECKKSQKWKKDGTYGNIRENDITQSCIRMLYNGNNGRKQMINTKKEQVNKYVFELL